MTIVAQLEFLRDSMVDWATSWKATAQIVADDGEARTLIMEGPNIARAMVYLAEEARTESTDHGGFVTRRYLIVLTRGRPMTIDQASGFVKTVSGKAPMFDLIEAGRTLLRGLNFTPARESDTSTRELILPHYLGARPWRGNSGFPVDAWEIEIEINSYING